MYTHQDLKKDFIKIILIASLIPFVISFVLLWFFFQDFQQRSKDTRSQIRHAQKIELLDSLQRIQKNLEHATQDLSFLNFFTSTLDNREKRQKDVLQNITNLLHSIPYDSVAWSLYDKQQMPLLASESHFLDPAPNTGVSLNLQKKIVSFCQPIDLKYITKKQDDFFCVFIPESSFQKKYPSLIEIEGISKELSLEGLRVQFKDTQEKANTRFIYISIFSVFLTLFFCHFFAIKMIKRRIKTIGSLQKELKKSLQMAAIGKMAHWIAHDIKKPFSQIFQLYPLIQDCHDIHEIKIQFKKKIEKIESNAKYIDLVLCDMVDAGMTRLQSKDDVSVEKIIAQCTKNFFFENILLEQKYAHSFYIKVDESKLTRVFSNLISNAIEAIDNQVGHKIWIHTCDTVIDQMRFVKIVLGNTGSHINPKDIHSIFDPFFTTNKKNGSGLGLAIAQKIVQLHEGAIECESDPEKGVVFSILIPASSLAVFQKEMLAPQKYLFSSENELIVIDDDPLVLKNWQRQNKDISVQCFLSPDDLFLAIDQRKVCLEKQTFLVSDFYFQSDGNFDFWTFSKKIRLQFHGPFFLSSNHCPNDVEKEALRQLNVTLIEKKPIKFLLLAQICCG